MGMLPLVRRASWSATVAVVAILLGGCPSSEKKPETVTPQHASEDAGRRGDKAAAAKPVKHESKTTAKEETTPLPKPKAKPGPEEDLAEAPAEKPRDLGPPLVEDMSKLIRLDPKQPVWIDAKNKHVVLQGEVCKAGYPLEFFATYSNRSYEAAVSVNVTPSIAHAGLMAVGAEPGHPAKFDPEFAPPTGTEVAIEVRWKDDKGNVKSAPAQEWIRNIKTKKPLDCNWVFAGSYFVTDEATGKKYYQADSGELICVLNLPNAMLDLPLRSYGAIEARSFEAFEEHLPPAGTPITILLKPILGGKPTASKVPAKLPSENLHPEVEKLAIEAAEPWIALADKGEYSRCWETAAEFLKDNVDRKDFVKALNASRKSLGDVKSRKLESKQYVTTLPGGPDGKYVILQYKTVFANKKSAVETITPMLDKDKKWRVSGYYVK
jgi:hypothetical protein